MAIAFDAFGSGTVISGTSISYSHTTTGSDIVLVAALVEVTGTTKRSGAPTYNGGAMTQIGSDFVWSTGNRLITFWYVLNPATGSNTVACSFGSSGTAGLATMTYTGCDTSSQPDNSAFQSSGGIGGTTYTSDVTSSANNCWHVAFFTGNSGTPSAGASTTERGTSSTFSGKILGGYDGNAAITPAGASTLNFNISATTTRVAVGATLKPLASASSNSNFLAFF